MKYSLFISEEAKNEVANAYLWYEENNEMGERFLAAFWEQCTMIESNPYQFPIKYKLFRSSLLRYFPFHMIYEIMGSKITLYAVYQVNRHPSTKRSAL